MIVSSETGRGRRRPGEAPAAVKEGRGAEGVHSHAQRRLTRSLVQHTTQERLAPPHLRTREPRSAASEGVTRVRASPAPRVVAPVDVVHLVGGHLVRRARHVFNRRSQRAHFLQNMTRETSPRRRLSSYKIFSTHAPAGVVCPPETEGSGLASTPVRRLLSSARARPAAAAPRTCRVDTRVLSRGCVAPTSHRASSLLFVVYKTS